MLSTARGLLHLKGSRALLVFLVAVAVATVLITPDPTDDIHGILRLHKSINVSVIAVLFAQLPNLLAGAPVNYSQASSMNSRNSVQFLCNFRC